MADPVQVWRGPHGEPERLFGPLPGLRSGSLVAYEFELPPRFEPWPGRSRLERTFVLATGDHVGRLSRRASARELTTVLLPRRVGSKTTPRGVVTHHT